MGASRHNRIQMIIVTATLFFLMAYVGSYGVLSRRGFEMADKYDLEGFYFYFPQDTDRWRQAESNLRLLYLPLIHVDCWMETGRRPAAEPLQRLE